MIKILLNEWLGLANLRGQLQLLKENNIDFELYTTIEYIENVKRYKTVYKNLNGYISIYGIPCNTLN